MLSQIKNKRGISIMIGYILLVTLAVVMSFAVYSWIKTYVPKDPLACPDGASIFLKNYECTAHLLTLTLQNNGRFDIGGYYVSVSTVSGADATIDISEFITNQNLKLGGGDMIIFQIPSGDNYNLFTPGDTETHTFDLTSVNNIYSVKILPTRHQVDENKKGWVVCDEAVIKEDLTCSVGGISAPIAPSGTTI
ncbi:MAG: hypothetical protein ABIA78_04470 [archaeon]